VVGIGSREREKEIVAATRRGQGAGRQTLAVDRYGGLGSSIGKEWVAWWTLCLHERRFWL
jgi:hypothetical protein